MNQSSQGERDDDVSLFNRTYEQYHRPLYAYLLARAGEATAADLLQDTFLHVWRHINSLRQVPDDRHRFWLFSLAGNVLTDHYRRNAVRQRHEPSPMASDEEYRGPGATAAETDSRLDMDAAIARLPEGLRVIVVMRYLGEMNSDEIGDALGMPAGTVRYRLAQARKQLSTYLAEVRQATTGVAKGARPNSTARTDVEDTRRGGSSVAW